MKQLLKSSQYEDINKLRRRAATVILIASQKLN